MTIPVEKLSVEEKLRLVGDLWDSIAVDAGEMPATPEERRFLERRLAEYELDGDPGEPAVEVLARLRKRQ